jgi:hypothetical protein
VPNRTATVSEFANKPVITLHSKFYEPETDSKVQVNNSDVAYFQSLENKSYIYDE